jgi:hypothetical protein
MTLDFPGAILILVAQFRRRRRGALQRPSKPRGSWAGGRRVVAAGRNKPGVMRIADFPAEPLYDRPMIRRLAILCLVGWLGPARAETSAPPATLAATNSPAQTGWQVGERLNYRLYWGFVPVGTAVVTTEWAEAAGRKLLAIRLRTRSNKVIATVYPVDDVIESLIDPVTLLPARFTKNMSEGNNRYHEVTVFDHAAGVAHWESLLNGRKKEFKIKPDTRDIPSMMYFLRGHRFVPGAREHFEVMADEKIYDLWLNTRKKEPVKLNQYGSVPSILVEPDAAFNGLFVRKGKIWVWISDDPRCLATKVVAVVPVANVRALLCSVEGPGEDFWVRKGDGTARVPCSEDPESDTTPAGKR